MPKAKKTGIPECEFKHYDGGSGECLRVVVALIGTGRLERYGCANVTGFYRAHMLANPYRTVKWFIHEVESGSANG